MTGAPGSIGAVGHVGIRTRNWQGLTDFYREVVGLKQVVHENSVISIFEVGSTHFFIMVGDARGPSFDFTSPDLAALRTKLLAAGVPCEPRESDEVSGHDSFSFEDPDGNRISVCNSHPTMPAVSL